MEILIYIILSISLAIILGFTLYLTLSKSKDNFKRYERVKYKPGKEFYNQITLNEEPITKIIKTEEETFEKLKHKKVKESEGLTIKDWCTKILPYALLVIFTLRIFSSRLIITYFIGLDSFPLYSKFAKVIYLLLIWFNVASVVIVIMRKFFDFKLIKNLTRFITGPSFLLNLIFIKQILMLMQGNRGITIMAILHFLELVIGLVISIYYFYTDFNEKNKAKDILKMLGIFVLMLLPAIPNYLPQFMFGYGNIAYVIKGISFHHRLFLYVGIITPVVLYFTLRNKPQEVIRFALIYISITTLIGFVVNYDYTDLLTPWSWPFHLCNTAMFIIPLCLIFRMKKLFYFTYFINVLGAVFAMLMPNYDASTNILSFRVTTFWINHWIAAFMPVLIVALKEFKRPHIKQFIWSMVGFFGYFVLVLILNVVFTAKGHVVDFFFINSNFVGDKLGNWTDKMFNITLIVNAFGMNLEFHPVYQLVFFLVYVALGLAVWFVYAEFFKIADAHYELKLKLKQIKLDQIARLNVISAERREQIMSEIQEITLKLKQFSKKYATSKVYAVKDANLEVYGGEIFGFLGPNGAGKSTIIKSIVGIQPISEGAIEVCGADVATEAVKAKSFIGYVPDHYALYEKLTGREYINYIADIYEVSMEERNERIEKYIKLFELEHSIDSKIRTYSHGMKQKITIMAALVHNPKVWILDEPLTGLDPNSIYQVKECMKQHASEGNIVFFSSHLIDIVEKLCQRIAIIKKGQIQCVKTVDEIEGSGTTLEQFYLDTIKGKEEGE